MTKIVLTCGDRKTIDVNPEWSPNKILSENNIDPHRNQIVVEGETLTDEQRNQPVGHDGEKIFMTVVVKTTLGLLKRLR